MKYRTVTVSAADAGVFAQALARRDLAFDLSAVHYEAISNFLLAWNQAASTEHTEDDEPTGQD